MVSWVKLLNRHSRAGREPRRRYVRVDVVQSITFAFAASCPPLPRVMNTKRRQETDYATKATVQFGDSNKKRKIFVVKVFQKL